jgi:hypothetical protein
MSSLVLITCFRALAANRLKSRPLVRKHILHEHSPMAAQLATRNHTRFENADLAGHPDFVKTHLQYSEEYRQRKNDPAYFDWKGLDPELLPHIVRRAHRSKLRVSTHIETAADFHNALLAGVDEVTQVNRYTRHQDSKSKSALLSGPIAPASFATQSSSCAQIDQTFNA